MDWLHEESNANNLIQERAMDTQYTKNVLFGLMIGGLAGAAAILLFAAQSATLAHAKIRRQGIRWLDRAAGIANHSPMQGSNAAGMRTPGNMTVHIG
jgi:gas vesicle protein